MSKSKYVSEEHLRKTGYEYLGRSQKGKMFRKDKTMIHYRNGKILDSMALRDHIDELIIELDRYD